ncbi:hypothetical protein [Gilvimarinus sp. DA14]|uniref:hypothetical protein n=1 Tax=Gilvimarinus sp. DA14 TaxID=2956798 RepID=UPI0020B87537|nr:hypothetical protein [Gilvimarinus sp. DA14]UTF58932.1 hypothetical protein NHM04_10625 [Gilvimarinus sp. DA14]
MKPLVLNSAVLIAALLLPLAAQAQDERLESTITGNQEQPQVLYIVPWQTPDSPTLKYDVVRDQSAAVFEHLERSELHRELNLLDQIEPASQASDKNETQVTETPQPTSTETDN